MKEKICPLMTVGVLANNQTDTSWETCRGSSCQFWTSAFTTENIEIFDCAIVIGALKNEEGKIPV